MSTSIISFTASGGTTSTVTSTSTNLSQTADTYNGKVIYNSTQGVYYVVEDYAYGAPTFTFTINDCLGGDVAANNDVCYVLIDVVNPGVTTYYTLTQMLSMIGVRLKEYENIGNRDTYITPELLTAILNQAQKKTVMMVDPEELIELDSIDTSCTIATGNKFAWTTGLANAPLEGAYGIYGVKLNETAAKFCKRISQKEYQIMYSSNYTFNPLYPYYYISGSYIYILGKSVATTIDVFYKREPVKMVLHATTDSSNVNCEFNAQIQEIILDMATAIAFENLNEDSFAQKYYRRSYERIQEINQKHTPSDVGKKESSE